MMMMMKINILFFSMPENVKRAKTCACVQRFSANKNAEAPQQASRLPPPSLGRHSPAARVVLFQRTSAVVSVGSYTITLHRRWIRPFF